MSQEYVPLTYHFYKRSKKPRRKLPPLKTIKNKLELICKILIRRKYGNECYTCDAKNLQAQNWQTGHFIARKVCGTYLKWDLRNLRPQCGNCNSQYWGLGGNGAVFYRNMVEREGQAYVDQIFADKNIMVKERQHYPQLLEKYERMLNGKN